MPPALLPESEGVSDRRSSSSRLRSPSPPPCPQRTAPRHADQASSSSTPLDAADQSTSSTPPPSPPPSLPPTFLLPPIAAYFSSDELVHNVVRAEPESWEEAFKGILRPGLLWKAYAPPTNSNFKSVAAMYNAWTTDREVVVGGERKLLPSFARLEETFPGSANGRVEGWRSAPGTAKEMGAVVSSLHRTGSDSARAERKADATRHSHL